MKKSLIALAVAGAVALPSFASAEVKIGGDARYRMNEKTTTDDVRDRVDNSTDSRIRMVVQFEAESGVKGYVRFDMHEADNHGASDGFGPDSGWMSVPLGPVTVRGGRVRDDWGNRFGSWDNDYDQVDVSMKAGMVDINVWRITNSEGGRYDKEAADPSLPILAGEQDNDVNDDQSTGVDITIPVGMGELGLRFASDVAEKLANNQDDGTGSNVGPTDVTGSTTDIYYRGKIGPGMLLGEYVSRSGDYHDGGSGDAQTGLYVHWIQKIGPVKGEVGVVSTAHGFAGENNFELFSTVGTAQDTGLFNVGGAWQQTVIALKGTMDVAKDTSLTLGLASISGKATENGDDGTGTAIDLVLKHKVDKATTVAATYGVINLSEEINPMQTGANQGDYKGTAMGVNMSTKF